MRCNILGNGKSRNLFKDDGSFKIALNYYSVKNPDILLAIDKPAIRYLEKNNFFNTNAIINDNYETDNPNVIGRVNSRIDHLEVDLKKYGRKSVNLNVGHAAYHWARSQKYDEIYLWGFDVLYNKSLVSLSDTIFGQTEKYRKYATFTDLPASGSIPGNTAFVIETSKLYIWSGKGWYLIDNVTNASSSAKFVRKAEYYIDVWEKIIDVPTYVKIPKNEKLITNNKNIIGLEC